MKKMNRKFIILFLILFIILAFSISILFAKHTNHNTFSSKDKEKTNYEIQYMDSQIVSMADSCGLSVDWQALENKTNQFYHYWNSAILDLNTLEINKTILRDFGKDLDNLNIAIKNKNKQDTLTCLVTLYHSLIVFTDTLSSNDSEKNLLNTKYYLLMAYSVVENNNWTRTQEHLLKSDQYFLRIVNALDDSSYHPYNINQAYIAIKELENTILTQNLDLFYQKYQLTMEKLNKL